LAETPAKYTQQHVWDDEMLSAGSATHLRKAADSLVKIDVWRGPHNIVVRVHRRRFDVRVESLPKRRGGLRRMHNLVPIPIDLSSPGRGININAHAI
jgi:hypothetical protein